MTREEELAAIERFAAEKGVTKCGPPRDLVQSLNASEAVVIMRAHGHQVRKLGYLYQIDGERVHAVSLMQRARVYFDRGL